MFCNLNCLKAYSLTDNGLVFIQKIADKSKKQRELANKKKDAEIKKKEKEQLKNLGIEVYAKENKANLQDNINRLARMIDAKCGLVNCICCGLPMNKQIHGAHLHAVNKNESLRFNLENIWSATSQCNKYSNTHLDGYKQRLAELFGEYYKEYLWHELPLKYKSIKLSAKDIHEKLVLVRKLIRNFEKDNEGTFGFPDLIFKRKHYNELIGIYK